MTTKEKEVFTEVLNVLQWTYPERELGIVDDHGDTMVSVDGKVKFNTSGYNLLYCLSKLTDSIQDELY